MVATGSVSFWPARSKSLATIQHAPAYLIVGAGAFLGELAQLAGRPALVDACARKPVEALMMLVAEAELGERIMRALILRRVGLLETGRADR
jgi:hypothetical protein